MPQQGRPEREQPLALQVLLLALQVLLLVLPQVLPQVLPLELELLLPLALPLRGHRLQFGHHRLQALVRQLVGRDLWGHRSGRRWQIYPSDGHRAPFCGHCC